MAFADFNRDGRRDAVLSASDSPYLHFYYGDSDSRWSEVNVRFTGVHGRHLAPAADLNGDGFADLALFDWYQFITGLTVLFNDGAGRFTTATRLAPVSYRDTPVIGDFHEGGGAELAFLDGNAIEIVSGAGNQLRLVSSAASGMGNTVIRGGRFRAGGGLDLLAIGELGYKRPASRMLFAEGGTAATPRAPLRRMRAAGRAQAAAALPVATYEGRALGTCPPAGLDLWSFTREGIFIDFEQVNGAVVAEGAMVNEQMVVRVALPDGATLRRLTGVLAVTPESLGGDLTDMARSACGFQGHLTVKAKRVE
jgi:hypothetical protein